MAGDAGDERWSERVAVLVVDALVTAKVLPMREFERAKEITKEEILVRLALEDRPKKPG